VSAIHICYNAATFTGDIAPLTTAVIPEPENPLQTLIYTVLFTNARVALEEALQAGLDGSELGGHWADMFYEQSFGSKLWLLKAAKNIPVTHERARLFADAALKQFIPTQYARSFTVSTSRKSKTAMNIVVTALLNDGSEFTQTEEFSFASV